MIGAIVYLLLTVLNPNTYWERNKKSSLGLRITSYHKLVAGAKYFQKFPKILKIMPLVHIPPVDGAHRAKRQGGPVLI